MEIVVWLMLGGLSLTLAVQYVCALYRGWKASKGQPVSVRLSEAHRATQDERYSVC